MVTLPERVSGPPPRAMRSLMPEPAVTELARSKVRAELLSVRPPETVSVPGTPVAPGTRLAPAGTRTEPAMEPVPERVAPEARVTAVAPREPVRRRVPELTAVVPV